MRNRRSSAELKGITLKNQFCDGYRMEIGNFVTDGEFTHDKNFAPKQNEKICPMTINVTGQTRLSSFRANFLSS